MAEALKKAIEILLGYWWIITPIALFFIFRELWLNYVKTKYLKSLEWILLEIKIPKESSKTPKAMEQIFIGLHGTESIPKPKEKWLSGKVPTWFSFEITGDGGFIHFYIRTLKVFRNLVEAQIYAQYPDAEITEVNDYTDVVPFRLDSEYDAWGAEFILTKPDPYPIKTYPEFFKDEEEKWIDPLASLGEVFSNLQTDEHIWIQILASPISNGWKEEGKKLIEKLIGREIKPSKKGVLKEEIFGWSEAFKESLNQLISGGGGASSTQEKPSSASSPNLTPGEKEVVLAIERNISKMGYKVIVRVVYWGKTEVFNKANIAAIVGILKQFNSENLNGFKPNGKTMPKGKGLFKKKKEIYKKIKILREYKERFFPFDEFKSRGFVFNTEELATIFHIPSKVVEAVGVPRVEAKKGGPPSGLPINQ